MVCDGRQRGRRAGAAVRGYEPTPIILEVRELATRAEGLLALALLLILRGDRLAFPIKRALLNAAACMLDAHDAVSNKKEGLTW
jgi:hypothetical protein